MKKKIIAIILARKNSTRIKNKNLRKINNKSLIEITLEKAIATKIFEKIYLSTDSKKIKDIARKYKIEILNREKNLSGASVKSETVILNILKKIKTRANTFMLLQPTSPFRTVDDIVNSYKLFVKNKLHNLVSVSKKVSNNFIIRSLAGSIFIDSKKVKMSNGYYFNGAIYIAKINYFLKYKNFYKKKPNYFLMKNKNSVDIDVYSDLILARKIF